MRHALQDTRHSMNTSGAEGRARATNALLLQPPRSVNEISRAVDSGMRTASRPFARQPKSCRRSLVAKRCGVDICVNDATRIPVRQAIECRLALPAGIV